MQEETEKPIINIELLDQDLLDNAPLSIFISNHEIPHLDDSSSSDSSTKMPIQEKKLTKAGRKRKRPLEIGEKEHSKDAHDNILRKIQVHFLTFIINYANAILSHLNYSFQFIDIDYHIKKVISKEKFSALKKKNIGEILCQEISPKFKTYKKDNNSIIYDKVKNNKIVNYFLSQNFLKLFKEVYLKNKRYVNENGLFFQLSEKVETLEDLLNKVKEYDDINDYRQKINEVIQIYYLNYFVVKNNN